MADFDLSLEELDTIVQADAAEESPGKEDERLDRIAAWHTSEERAQYEAAYNRADRKMAVQEADALAAKQADLLVAKAVRSATNEQWEAVSHMSQPQFRSMCACADITCT